MPKKERRTIRDNVIEEINSLSSRNKSVIPAMKNINNVKASRRNVMHGRRKRRNRENDVRSGVINWNISNSKK